MIFVTFIIIFMACLVTVIMAMSFGLLKLLLFIIALIFVLELIAYCIGKKIG